MEVCNCVRYGEIADKSRVFTFGDLRPSEPKLPVPENSCIFWKTVRTSHEDYRPDKPILIKQVPKKQEDEIVEAFDTKWIPLMNHLISERFVKETKIVGRPF
ncbi:unnamed protein product [Ceutorhynchus assimilis]|uniref:Uncharacterized protein n=1 Tax=Ceutorhynchus assimilis TaxID=467358 RepID=A0A9N9MNE9_9CUCU|nr:unnamed protein product [Ceutorhynchus assimilis]